MTPELVLFYGLGAVSLLSAIAAVGVARTLFGSALGLGVSVLSLSGIYVLLHAELVAVAQLLVHGASLLVLLLFIVALRADRNGGQRPESTRAKLAIGFGAAVATALGSIAMLRLFSQLPGVVSEPGLPAASFGGFRSLGLALYGPFVVPVELTALVLGAAALGVLSLSRSSVARESDPGPEASSEESSARAGNA